MSIKSMHNSHQCLNNDRLIVCSEHFHERGTDGTGLE